MAEQQARFQAQQAGRVAAQAEMAQAAREIVQAQVRFKDMQAAMAVQSQFAAVAVAAQAEQDTQAAEQGELTVRVELALRQALLDRRFFMPVAEVQAMTAPKPQVAMEVAARVALAHSPRLRELQIPAVAVAAMAKMAEDN